MDVRYFDPAKDAIPSDEYSQFVARYFEPFLKNGIQPYIGNLRIEIRMVLVGKMLVPISVGHSYVPGNCYVGSVLGVFEYALDEIGKVPFPIVRGILRHVTRLCLRISEKCEFEKNVSIGNLLLSTNILPNLDHEAVSCLLDFLIKEFPGHSYAFRSVNTANDSGKFLSLVERIGFFRIISRQIFTLDRKFLPRYVKLKNIREDERLIRKWQYIDRPFDPGNAIETRRVVELYNRLYLEKYSTCNPHYTEAFIAHIAEKWLFEIRVLEKEGTIDAAYGHYRLLGQITPPIFGYDTSRGTSAGLYRQISSLTFKNAFPESEFLNFSSGVWRFKMLRGASCSLEYACFYSRHLPFWRKAAWLLIRAIARGIAEPLLRNHVF